MTERYIQIQNPRSKLWVKVDREEGRVTHKKSKGPFKGIEKIKREANKTRTWQRRVEGLAK